MFDPDPSQLSLFHLLKIYLQLTFKRISRKSTQEVGSYFIWQRERCRRNLQTHQWTHQWTRPSTRVRNITDFIKKNLPFFTPLPSRDSQGRTLASDLNTAVLVFSRLQGRELRHTQYLFDCFYYIRSIL